MPDRRLDLGSRRAGFRRTLLAAACLAGLVATTAPADARTILYVRGRVVDGSGKPVKGAHVSFELRPDGLGANQRDCAVRKFEPQCRVHRVAGTTDAQGKYKLPVERSSYLAKSIRHVLVVTDRAMPGVVAPARTQIHLYFPGRSLDVSDLRVWRARPSVEPAGPLHRTVGVEPLPAAYGRTTAEVHSLVELLQDGRVVWSYDVGADERRIDARTVEAGTNAIRAFDIAYAGRYEVSYWSSAYPVTGGVRPLSRGAKCFTYGRDDALLPLSACKFTDGRLGTPIDTAYQQVRGKGCDVKAHCGHPRWVLADLGAVQPVGALAVRGCTPGVAETSFDGSVFTAYQPVDGVGDGLRVGVPVPARYVRVDLAPCVFTATEVSVFAPA